MVRLEPAKPLLRKVGVIRFPFLCIITPVFDPAYASLCKLIAELYSQTLGRFIHVMISNGPSPNIKELICKLNMHDLRFIYDEMTEETIYNPIELLINLGKRRDYCLKKYNAARYLFLDADVKLIDNDYFKKLYKAHKHINRDILITLTKYYDQNNEITLPIFPIREGHIDMANYSFSQKIAKNFNYPMDYDIHYGIANDYRFFSSISSENNTAILNFVSAIRDGNSSYKRATELFNEYQQ